MEEYLTMNPLVKAITLNDCMTNYPVNTKLFRGNEIYKIESIEGVHYLVSCSTSSKTQRFHVNFMNNYTWDNILYPKSDNFKNLYERLSNND